MTPPRYWTDLRPEPKTTFGTVFLVVPHSGAGARAMAPLVRHLPPDWGALGLSLPGRERRLRESPDWAPAEVAREAAAEAVTLLDQPPYRSLPLVVAGQCTGAWLAYAILLAGPGLQQRCRKLFVFSQMPWDVPRPSYTLPADSAGLWARLAATGNTEPEIVADEEFRAAVEPVIRADYRAAEEFPTCAGPVSCPIAVVTGSRDRNRHLLEPAGWARYAPALETTVLDCGHLAMQELPDASARVLAELGGCGPGGAQARRNSIRPAESSRTVSP